MQNNWKLIIEGSRDENGRNLFNYGAETMTDMRDKIRYDALDGFRAYSAVGIVLMHILTNGGYRWKGFIFERLIPSFTNLVFLFMIVSGFSMCCGYYDRIINNKISVNEFYSKRYAKIWPFFSLLCILELVISPSSNVLYEVFANLTLCFGLLPNAEISVIGVGWFLGLVFVFYLLFPFFCYLISSKKRAWVSFLAAIIFNYLCIVRFGAGRENIVYCSEFFFAGGLVFLYKEPLERMTIKYRRLLLITIAVLICIYYTVSDSVQVLLALFSGMLIYGLRNAEGAFVLCNPFTKLLSSISMEVYLGHMVIFRIIEKLGMTRLFDLDILSYIATSIGTIAGTIVFSLVVKKSFECLVQFRKA